MWDLVENPEDRFSHDEAHMVESFSLGFRPKLLVVQNIKLLHCMYLESLVHIMRVCECGPLLVPVVGLYKLPGRRGNPFVLSVVRYLYLILRAQEHKLSYILIGRL